MGGVSVEANNESVAALAGIQPQDILMSEWRNSTYRRVPAGSRLLVLLLAVVVLPDRPACPCLLPVRQPHGCAMIDARRL